MFPLVSVAEQMTTVRPIANQLRDALLLLRHNQPVPQDALIDALWNGDVPRTARAAFQNLIYALRQALGSETLERQPAGYVLHSPPDEARVRAERTDWLTVRGETLEEAALVHRLAGDDDGGSNALRAALSVYEQKRHLAGARRVRQSMRG